MKLSIAVFIAMLLGMWLLRWGAENEINRLSALIGEYHRTDSSFYFIEYINDNGILTKEQPMQIKAGETVQIDFKKPPLRLIIIRGATKGAVK